MTTNEYWQLLKDIRIAKEGFGDKNSARFDLIFHKSNQKIGLRDERENNPDRYVARRLLCTEGGVPSDTPHGSER